MKAKKDNPKCDKCKTVMQRISTGSMVVTYKCPACKDIKIVKREKL